MKLYIEFSWNYDTAELLEYLKEKELRIFHKNQPVKEEDVDRLMPGMALKHKSGVMVRVMNRFTNYENLSNDFLLAAVNIRREDLELFAK